ncbi:glycoside hydrolase family 43 protein [Gilvimarinus polysaccharolyticus]|uniref:glycoside hydrolase family 43 protein n=1 Tax=Gilvimarinus polysaccharolyticus TaxID=863921 RepID=UPI000A7BFD93|nr:glycoside hydrolase family 43 protein [Gilvimarinus polysaccharolyticus]
MTDANMINNPILKGFNPDPSICRVEDDYYIATSTFEWFPGVQIHHSTDLANWTLLTHPLDRLSQLNMQGHPNSCGVWAPCLTHHDGLFYLIYTDVREYQTDYQVRKNYLVTSANIMGPWSEPIYLNASGFDPSLFHDDDGRKWLLNVLWDHRPAVSIHHHSHAKNFAGIVIQEYDPNQKKLVGPIDNIFKGSDLGLVEGSHLYKMHGYYYLLTAEGGTFVDHAALFARSKNLLGPYEIDPQAHFLNSASHPSSSLRRSGHGDLVTLPNGDHYFVHLTGRPLPYRGRCVLGRETAIQKVVMSSDGWPRLAHNHKGPEQNVPNSLGVASDNKLQTEHFDFCKDKLTLHYQTPRIALTEPVLSYDAKPGYLRLLGQEAPSSLYQQSLIARRQQAFCFTAETSINFQPESFQQMAGLISFYNTQKFIYLCITHDPLIGRALEVVMATMSGSMRYPLGKRIPLPAGDIKLRIEVEYDQWRGSWASQSGDWQPLGGYIDYSGLADEVDAEHFTGAFVGLACHDLSGRFAPADFSSFSYIEHE